MVTRNNAAVLILIALVVGKTIGAPGADSPTPRAPSIDNVRRAWEARQRAIRTARLAWSEDWLIAARSQSPRPEGKSSLPDHNGPALPLKDVTFKCARSMSLSGQMLRVVHEGFYWHPVYEEILEDKSVDTFDGETAATHHVHVPSRSHGLPPLGFIQKMNQNKEAKDWVYGAPLMALRPCDPNTGGVDLGKYRVSRKTGVVDGVRCVLISTFDPKQDVVVFWLDPLRGFLPLRLEEQNRGITIDVSYRCMPVGIWVPSGWKGVIVGPFIWAKKPMQFGVCQQVVARVSKCEINVEIPRSEFQIVFPPDTLVRDLKNGKDYIAKARDEKRIITKAEIHRGASYEEYLSTPSGEAGLKPSGWTRRAVVWAADLALAAVVLFVVWFAWHAWRRAAARSRNS